MAANSLLGSYWKEYLIPYCPTCTSGFNGDLLYLIQLSFTGLERMLRDWAKLCLKGKLMVFPLKEYFQKSFSRLENVMTCKSLNGLQVVCLLCWPAYLNSGCALAVLHCANSFAAVGSLFCNM